MNGCEYRDIPRLWEVGFKSALQSIGEIGRVYTLRQVDPAGGKGKLIALATCYTPGNESSDRPMSTEYRDELAKLPEAQIKFRREVRLWTPQSTQRD